MTLFLPQGVVGLAKRLEEGVNMAEPSGDALRPPIARRRWPHAPRPKPQPASDASYGRQVDGELDLTHGVVLYLEGITVSFDGFKALNNLSLAIDAGELRCVIGPNGAGKTTMMDVITGKTRPDAGTRLLRPDHRPHAALRSADRARRHRPQVPEADDLRAPHARSRTSSSR